jgi:hypothetical protein
MAQVVAADLHSQIRKASQRFHPTVKRNGSIEALNGVR